MIEGSDGDRAGHHGLRPFVCPYLSEQPGESNFGIPLPIVGYVCPSELGIDFFSFKLNFLPDVRATMTEPKKGGGVLLYSCDYIGKKTHTTQLPRPM